VRERGDGLDVEQVLLGVGDALAEERLRVGTDGGAPGLDVVGVLDKGDVDAELGQRVVEEVVGAAVEAGAGDDVVAGLGDVEDRHQLRGLAARDEERADAALEAREPLLDGVLGGVHDPRVDVAEFLEGEQVRRVVGIAEDVRRRLVDGQRAGAGGGVGGLAGVDLSGLEGPAVGHGYSSHKGERAEQGRNGTRRSGRAFARTWTRGSAAGSGRG
jgi:hypothetical protein